MLNNGVCSLAFCVDALQGPVQGFVSERLLLLSAHDAVGVIADSGNGLPQFVSHNGRHLPDDAYALKRFKFSLRILLLSSGTQKLPRSATDELRHQKAVHGKSEHDCNSRHHDWKVAHQHGLPAWR